jgi:hypothetical protein
MIIDFGNQACAFQTFHGNISDTLASVEPTISLRDIVPVTKTGQAPSVFDPLPPSLLGDVEKLATEKASHSAWSFG